MTWLILLALFVQTPAPPDFSGAWILDVARSSAAGGGTGGGRGGGQAGGGGGLGRGPSATELVMTQSASALEIVELRPQMKTRLVLALTGTEGRYEIVSGENAGRPATATSHWKGDRLVTMVTLRTSGEGVRLYTEQRYLDGDSFVVEITMAGSSNSRKSVYVRKRE